MSKPIMQYFQWRQSRGASEKFHGAVIGHDGREDSRVFQETAAVGRALERLATLAGSLRARQAAIVVDWESRMAMQEAQGPRNAGLGYWEEVMRHYQCYDHRGGRLLAMVGWTLLYVLGGMLLTGDGVALAYLTGTLSVYVLWCYNGQRGWNGNKYWFYLCYPLHLLAAWGISVAI